MECLVNEPLLNWLLTYGSITLFLLLTVGIVALPVPEETLMVIAGVLMRSGALNIPGTLLASYAGSICGISISYFAGRALGKYFLTKYGSWAGITEAKFEQAHAWFEKYGKWVLPIGYFVPGVRHFTGFSAGTTKLNYRDFALFAYTGGLIWVSTFLALGYFFGNYCLAIYANIENYLGVIFLVVILAIVVFIIFKIRKSGQ